MNGMEVSKHLENLKDYAKEVIYKIRYSRKFKKLNIDKSFSDMLTSRNEGKAEKEIFHIMSKSKNKEDFANNIREYLKSKQSNMYANVLLIGNLIGKYSFNNSGYYEIKGLNIDAFSKENQEILQELKKHFVEYVINDNRRKNSFLKSIKVGILSGKDLTKDINEKELLEDFENFLKGNKIDGDDYTNSKSETIEEYLINTIGRYSEDDIRNNFDFILYDLNKSDTDNLDERRKKYLQHNNLSNSQITKIDNVELLKQRLQGIKREEAKRLLTRLGNIENKLDENISELEDIYRDYEVLYRQELIDNLYVPKEEVTVIEDYKDIKPQLIHKFLRETEKFRDLEIEKIKKKIISERNNGDTSQELTEEEQERMGKLMNQVDVNLDQYKVNYTTDGKETSYSDANGFNKYYSDTTNQISASVFNGTDLIDNLSLGIVGIGFNKETVNPEAIAISSNKYQTSNRGLYNMEYNDQYVFGEFSAPISELLKPNRNSEIVMHRRGMDYDTKASYIFAKIDSSNEKQTKEIMEEIEQVRKKEGLKVVIYDVYKINQSLERRKQEEQIR